MAFDFKLTVNGDVVFNNLQNDLDIVDNVDDMIEQQAICRIKSVTKDWYNAPEIGANIEKFLGYTNNLNTAQEMIDAITVALTYDDLVSEDDLFFIPRINMNSISILVFLNKKFSTPALINVEIDLVDGVKIKYDITQ